MAKPLNFQRRLRALETSKPAKGSNPVALAMIVQARGGTHVDRRHRAKKYGCRGNHTSRGADA